MAKKRKHLINTSDVLLLSLHFYPVFSKNQKVMLRMKIKQLAVFEVLSAENEEEKLAVCSGQLAVEVKKVGNGRK